MNIKRRSSPHLILASLLRVSLATLAASFAMHAAEGATENSAQPVPAVKKQTKRTGKATVGKTATGKTVAPELRVAPNKSDIVDCPPGDAKCVEDAAKMETKPTDGAIHDQTN